MSRRLNRSGLLLGLILASDVWALGLGDIRLDSALNEPLRAEIELVSATPEELESLRVNLASSETFQRYGIDRPVFLTRLQFSIRQQGATHVVRVTSQEPVVEPFVTFLVEANWARGRLLREYTVLLDPPTFAPPPAPAAAGEAVTAPRQVQPADRGRIQREPAPAPAPAPAPRQPDEPAPQADFDTAPGGEYRVGRGDNLWRIAGQVRPDQRVSMNQTMLAIYEANPEAFAGNINVLRAGATLRIPSADEIFRIGRRDALSEIARQNEAWTGGPAAQTTLTLVPPDDEQTPYQGAAGSDETSGEPVTDAAAQARIRRLENRIAEQESLLEVRDNELAELRSELARLRAEREQQAAGEPAGPAGEPVADTETPAAEDEAAPEEIFAEPDPATTDADEPAADDAAADADEPARPERPAPRIVPAPQAEPTLVDRAIGLATSFWGIVAAALVVVLGVLVWFARRASRSSEDADTGVWDALDADDEADRESVASTERLRAMARDDDSSIVVVEQESEDDTLAGDSVETPFADRGGDAAPAPAAEEPVSLEDTFSTDTAINLDQSDPIAEADFHMAYGLYDQAADLINGALAVEPERTDLLTKLCEIYFVWGNRDAFVESAERLKAATGDGGGDWDKVVIMGQQIAADHELFADARTGGATHAVDLDFESDDDGSSALDIDFAGEVGGDDVIDLGGEEDATAAAPADDDLDFSFGDDEEDTSASITREMPGRDGDDPTVESPALGGRDEDTVESPTIEQEAWDSGDDATSELPLVGEDDDDTSATSESRSLSSDATAEIDLDDLGLDLDGLGDDLMDDDDATGTELQDSLAETGRNERLEETGRNEQLDDPDATSTNTQAGDDLLDATGQTQILPDDFTVDTSNKLRAVEDDDATMLAPGPGGSDDDEDDDATMLSSTFEDEGDDFDFAKTEALPDDAYDNDATAESPRPGSTDMDLDLDDLTAALKRSESGNTIDQPRDDATVEQPRPGSSGDEDLDFDLDFGSDDPTQAIGPEDQSDDLREARTMTEVGTKLDLARAYVDMGDPSGARNILEEVLEEGDASQRQQAQQLLDSLPG